MKIENGVFVVTGGASGLGAGTARMIVEAGGRVVLADLQREAGEALARELGTVQACFVETDVSNEESAKAAIDAAVSGFGGLNGLINCAGIAPAEKVIGKDNAIHRLATFQKVINVNLVGTFNMIRLAADAMSRNAPYGKRGIHGATAFGNDNTLKNLNPFAGAFDNFNIDIYGIPNLEVGSLVGNFLHCLIFNCLN